ncbi:MAG TPA: SRPBCC family protein, partial [Polyangiaceae bacterium]
MQFRAEVAIQADPLEVWRTLVDFSSYHEWNPFITRIEGNLVAGAKFSTEFSLPERGELRFKPELVQCEPPQRL